MPKFRKDTASKVRPPVVREGPPAATPGVVASRCDSPRAALYEDITATIIAELEAGRVPWVQPWGTGDAKTALAMPRNASTGRAYSGINVLILWGAVIAHGFPVQAWLTFRQARDLGGTVRRGEHGTHVVYADRFIPGDEKRRAEETGKQAQSIPFLKRFTVFNLAQCEGLPPDLVAAAPPPDDGLIEPKVEALIRASGVDFRIGGNCAFYVPEEDYVRVPPPHAYFDPVNWHRTALHELSHATGAPHRLNRDLSGAFGSRSYAFEEMVTEMSAAFCCASLGIVPTVRHSDYIGAWLDILRDDNRAVVRAASQASKAADYLLGLVPGDLVSGDPVSGGLEIAARQDAGPCANAVHPTDHAHLDAMQAA